MSQIQPRQLGHPLGGQPIAAHVQRDLFFADANFDILLESLDPEGGTDIDIPDSIWTTYSAMRAAGKVTGKGWLDE